MAPSTCPICSLPVRPVLTNLNLTVSANATSGEPLAAYKCREHHFFFMLCEHLAEARKPPASTRSLVVMPRVKGVQCLL